MDKLEVAGSRSRRRAVAVLAVTDSLSQFDVAPDAAAGLMAGIARMGATGATCSL